VIQNHIHEHRQHLPDSLEISTPSRGGALKVYFDTGKPIEAENRIRAAIFLREIAGELVESGMSEKTFKPPQSFPHRTLAEQM